MMRVREKLFMDKFGIIEHGPINIVCFGDSVTHGALRGDLQHFDTTYWNRLRKKLCAVRDFVPINMINAGIGGLSAKDSLGRMEKQVFAHDPDLVIVCFGLNDVEYPLEEYIDSLRKIFARCNEAQVDTIFMTPNMMNTYVAEDTDEEYKAEFAPLRALWQTNGRMDLYMESAVKLAREMSIPVCDCYQKWKELSKTEDTTMLLINRINHPTAQMHELFAEELFKMIFPEND